MDSISLPSANTIKLISISTISILFTGITSYAVYFDYKRRHDSQFRKNLSKFDDWLIPTIAITTDSPSHYTTAKQNRQLQKSNQQQSASDIRSKLEALSRALVMISGEQREFVTFPPATSFRTSRYSPIFFIILVFLFLSFVFI